jgi:hypothetical protein
MRDGGSAAVAGLDLCPHPCHHLRHRCRRSYLAWHSLRAFPGYVAATPPGVPVEAPAYLCLQGPCCCHCASCLDLLQLITDAFFSNLNRPRDISLTLFTNPSPAKSVVPAVLSATRTASNVRFQCRPDRQRQNSRPIATSRCRPLPYIRARPSPVLGPDYRHPTLRVRLYSTVPGAEIYQTRTPRRTSSSFTTFLLEARVSQRAALSPLTDLAVISRRVLV